MCECITEISGKVEQHLQKSLAEKNETLVPISFDGGMQNTTLVLGDDNNPTGILLKTDFIFKTTFRKKDGSTSKPRNNHISLVYTYCPFCGLKYRIEEESTEP